MRVIHVLDETSLVVYLVATKETLEELPYAVAYCKVIRHL